MGRIHTTESRARIGTRTREYWADPAWRATQVAKLRVAAAQRWSGTPGPTAAPAPPAGRLPPPWQPRYLPVAAMQRYALSSIHGGRGPKAPMARREDLYLLVVAHPGRTARRYALALRRASTEFDLPPMAATLTLVRRDLAALHALNLVYTT